MVNTFLFSFFAQVIFLYVKGFYTSSKQLSLLLYGDTQHELSIQAIIDKLSPPHSFAFATKTVANIVESKDLSISLAKDFQLLQSLLVNNDDNPDWSTIKKTINLIKKVLKPLTELNSK
jgi:hypothetical protein